MILNQDPRLRAMIMPLFRFDPNAADERPFGLGTTFRIDPWGNCATAFHVIEDMLLLSSTGQLALQDNVRMTALEVEGIIMGRPPVPKDAWRLLSAFYTECGHQKPPLIHEPATLRNLTELACLTISRSHQRSPMPCLPIQLSCAPPVAGDFVTGYGFAGLDIARDGAGEDRPFSQYLYESAGEVIEVIPADPSSTMPWPRFRVAAEWPSGMSGGPVLNTAGNVIGLISRGWTGQADSTATHFSGWNVSNRTFRSIDPFEPNRYRGFAATDSKGTVQFMGQDIEGVKNFASENGMSVRAVSCSPETGEWIEL